METSSYTKINLNSAIGDLLLAGTETTTTTLKWCILYMMAYPEMQSRVQIELDHVVGRERLPRLDDRNDLPYTNAVLMEVCLTLFDTGEKNVKLIKDASTTHKTTCSNESRNYAMMDCDHIPSSY